MSNTAGFHVGSMLAAVASHVGAAGVFSIAADVLHILVIAGAAAVLVRG